jgi:HAD superfamily hydrolase (TIGR01509 family)
LDGREIAPERFAEMMHRTNSYYAEALARLSHDDILPGVLTLLGELSDRDVKLAAVSLSRNARTVLVRLGVMHAFDIIIDGNDLARAGSRYNRYLLAARALGMPPWQSVVIEDSAAGIAAAREAGMRSIGVGSPDRVSAATLMVESFGDHDAAGLVAQLTSHYPQ